MKKNGRKWFALVLALCVCAGLGFQAADFRLKADEEAPVTEEVTAPADTVIETVPDPEPAPAEEPVTAMEEIELDVSVMEEPAEEEPAEESPAGEAPAEESPAEETPAEEEPPAGEAPAEETPAEEVPAEEDSEEEGPAEEELPFSVETAYASYAELDEAGRQAFLAGLSDEDRAALEAYIQELKKAEVEPPVFSVHYESLDGDKIHVGGRARMILDIQGATEDMVFTYQWMYDDGNGWKLLPGATGSYYDVEVTMTNWYYNFACDVNWTLR